MGRDRRGAGRLGLATAGGLGIGALGRFLRGEAAGGTLLILGSLAALVWANAPAAPLYFHLLALPIGPKAAAITVQGAINDGLMSLFFLLAGLEIRHEMMSGSLASIRRAIAPGIAALGGMVAPALIYLALNHADPLARRGWAVPMATDIAFSLAVLRLLGARAGASLRTFLTALAILDDVGAILVIALFYARAVSPPMLAAALAVWALLFGLNRAGVRALWPYLGGGAALWVLVFDSGINATLAGVTLAFVVPASTSAQSGPSPARRLERHLAHWVAYAILPLFGLANAGLKLRGIDPALLLSAAPLGVFLGLFLGKQAGVFGATRLGQRLGVLHLPAGLGTSQLYGTSLLCGIGFTMSLFINNLAFAGTALADPVKLAILCASVLSAVCGLVVLRVSTRVGRIML